MKKFLFFVLLLFLLVSCAKEDLPPTPPPPGGEADVGRAIGGVPIAAALPAWAARILYTDISPERPRFGDTVVVTVEKPSTFQRDFLVFSEAYVLNKKVPSYLFWEKVNADSSLSGSITQKWARNKAVFKIPITQERFTSGLDYLVVYWCVDSGMRDSQGKKIWECNGNKWGLGAFDVVTEAYPDFLIEKDIENNRFKGSAKVTPQSFVNVQVSSGVFGNAYAASYLDLLSVMTNVTVVELLDVAQFKKDLSKDIANLSAGWTTKGGNVCGFLNVGSGFVSFSWLSGYYWVTVKSSGNVLDEAKIGNYAKFKPPKYQSNCNLLNELKTIANISEGCGNLIVEAGEECERDSQCAEEEVCRDCVCVIPSVCGNNETEYGEDCESDAECEENEICSDCKCIPAGCGNKLLEEGEECEAHKDCDEGEYCIDCECIASSCGDEFLTPDEECEYDEDCPTGEVCDFDCMCVAPRCGDDLVTFPEECEADFDCDVGEVCLDCECVEPSCGDGVVNQVSEECESPGDVCTKNNVNGTCSSNCKCNYCGDLKINQPAEQCEPPNTLTCDADCRISGPSGALPIYVCKRWRAVTDDHYLSNSLPCPDGDAQRIQGRLLPLSTLKKSDMVKIVQCYYPDGNEHAIVFDDCPSNRRFSSALGFGYKDEKPGTVLVALCRFDAGDEYYTMTDSCHSGSSSVGKFYALPFCEESDKSRNLLERGITKSLIDDTEYVDSCEDGMLREYYCSDVALPNGVKDELVSCPVGYSCQEGACVSTPVDIIQPDFVPLFSCRKSTTRRYEGKTRSFHDYYQNIVYPCEGDTLSIVGRLFKEQQEGTVVLKNCWAPYNEYVIAGDHCDDGTTASGDLGYAYTSEQPSTLPLRRCVRVGSGWGISEWEHFITTGICESGTNQEGVWYIPPACEDTDGGRTPRVKGRINAFDDNWRFTTDLYEDTCDGTAYVKEYYCDATKLPYGYDSNVVPCPVGTRCSGGACVPSGSVGQALYLGETEGELGSDVILLILALLAVVAVFVLNIWHFRK